MFDDVWRDVIFYLAVKYLNPNQFLIDMGVWYNPLRDGTIEEYITYCRSKMVPKCFKGIKQFQQLIDLGYITPLITSIRIMYNVGRDDEFYGIVEKFKLEGIILNAHSGKKGIHDPKELLSNDTPYFEVDMINPNPEPQKSTK